MREGKGHHRTPRPRQDVTVQPYKRRGKQQQVQTDPTTSEVEDRDIELATRLQEALNDCSRQRLRSLQMAFRRYANLDSRIQMKDLQSAFQESNIKLSSRTYPIIAEKFGDQNGIDYERLWKFLRKALYSTARDSIRAILTSNITDTSNAQTKSDTDTDKDLIERLKEQFDESEFAPNLESFRSFLRENDTSRCGKVNQNTVLDVVGMAKLPVYGSLLKSVLKRCDQEKNQQISWPEMINLLEMAWTELKEQYPDVANKPFPKEPSRASSINISSIQKRLLIKKQSLANGEPTETQQHQQQAHDSEKKTQRIPSAKPTPQTEKAAEKTAEKMEKADSEDEKRPSSKGGGFFKSVRGFLGAGKSKKQASPEKEDIPVIQVEKETKIQEDVPKIQNDDFIEVMINDKSHKIWCPDDTKILSVPDPPKERLKLDWIHGYGGRRDGSPILVLASQEITYYVGNSVVLYDLDLHIQRHYREHTDEIRAMSLHSDGVTLASGQCSAKIRSSNDTAHIRIWRSDTLQTTQVFGSGMIHLSTTLLAFVPDKMQLMSVDQSLDREMSLWDCSSGAKISSSKLSTEMVSMLIFHPTQTDLIITGGKEHLSWWKINEKGVILLQGKALYGSHLRPKYITCGSHNEKGDLVTGDSNGTIYVWSTKEHRLLNMVKHAHGGPITDLIIHRNSVMSTGKDHTVRNWLIEKYMDPIGTFQVSEQQGCIRALKKYKGQLLMGTTFNTILYFELNKKGHPFDPPIEMQVLTQGTKKGVQSILPLKLQELELYVAIGRDSGLDIFDAHDRRIVWHCLLDGLSITCADITIDGTLFVCGTNNGTLVGFILQRGEMKAENDDDYMDAEPIVWYDVTKTVEESQITEWCVQPSKVKISPDKEVVAIAGLDFNIYLAKTETQTDPETEEERQVFIINRTITGSPAVIVGLDFSKTEPWFIRSYDEGNQTKFWKLENQNEILAKDVRNEEWDTENCRNSFKMAGLWKTKSVTQSGISSHCVSHKESLVAVGCNDGSINLSRFPASTEGPFIHAYKSGLSRVQIVAFSGRDEYVITNCNEDTSVMQWKVL